MYKIQTKYHCTLGFVSYAYNTTQKLAEHGLPLLLLSTAFTF